MKNFKHWLSTMAVLLCSMVMNAQGITEISELSNSTLYHVSTARGAWILSEKGFASSKDLAGNDISNPDDPRQQFAFVSNNGGKTHYLYHVEAKMFIDMFWGRLSETPLTPVYFTKGAYEKTFVAYFDSLHYINIGGSYQMTIDSWDTPDDGNSCSIVPVGEWDPTAALAVLDEWSRPEEGVAYRALGNGEAEVTLASTSLKEITIPTTVSIDGEVCKVTSIGDCAFLGCADLASVAIPEGVKEIGAEAFYGCSAITSIALPESVERIGNCAFQYCSSLTSFKSSRTTSMGWNVFKGCESLEYLTLNSYSVDNTEFKGYSSLKEVVLGDYVSSIRESAFADCSNLTSITISGSVSEISNDAFRNCTSLKSVIFEDGSQTLSLGDSHNQDGVVTFLGCPLETIYLGRDIKLNNEKYLSLDGSHLTSITIGDEVTKIDDVFCGAFENLNEVHIKSVAAWCNIDFGGREANPLFWAKKLYLNGELVTEITIPEGVTSIGNYAFNNYSSLVTINIPESLEEIGVDAFSGTAWHENLSDGLHYAGKVLYKYVGEMPENTSIAVREGTKSIYDSAFAQCSGLTSITIPESVTSIGGYAFADCSNMLSFAMKGAANIGTEAFSGCVSLERIEFNGSYFEDWFRENSTIKEIVLGANVRGVDNDIFRNYSSLEYFELNCPTINSELVNGTSVKEVVLGEGVTAVENSAFADCANLSSITIGKNVKRIGEVGNVSSKVFDGCTSLREVIIEDGSDTLELGCNKYAARGAEGLFNDCPVEKVYLGRNLNYDTRKQAGYSPFYKKASLTSLTIGTEVTEIGEYAFSGAGMDTIICHATVPPTCYTDAFDGVDTSILVYVPETSLAEYQAAEVWRNFLNYTGVEAGIENVENSGIIDYNSEFIFDLMGRRVENPTKPGLYIVNGKKILIK